ncbi:MAG TPA: acyl carrier protein [Bacillota bacterium]|nr:acyl carrier protein [Bacillota bacterium]
MDIDQEIKEIVTQITGKDAAQMDPAATFTEDLGIDSLMVLELLAEIENKYDIEIPPEKLVAMKTLQGVINVAKEFINGDRENVQG